MRRAGAAAALALLAIALQGGAAAAQERPPLTEGQRAFVERYVEAIRSRDVARHKALVHPGSLACIRPETAAFFDEIFARQARYQVADNYKAYAPRPIPAGGPLMAEGEVLYPVRPTHWIQIDLSPGASGVIVMLQVVAERSTWYEVIPCPTAATMEKMRAAKVEGERDAERARALAAALPDPLRARLLDLIKQGQRVTAVREYSTESGEDLTMARRVIDVLRGRSR